MKSNQPRLSFFNPSKQTQTPTQKTTASNTASNTATVKATATASKLTPSFGSFSKLSRLQASVPAIVPALVPTTLPASVSAPLVAPSRAPSRVSPLASNPALGPVVVGPVVGPVGPALGSTAPVTVPVTITPSLHTPSALKCEGKHARRARLVFRHVGRWDGNENGNEKQSKAGMRTSMKKERRHDDSDDSDNDNDDEEEKEEKEKGYDTHDDTANSESEDDAKSNKSNKSNSNKRKRTHNKRVQFSVSFNPLAALARARERARKKAPFSFAPIPIPVPIPASTSESAFTPSFMADTKSIEDVAKKETDSDTDSDVDREVDSEVDESLWEHRHAPKSITDLVGNKPAILGAISWMTAFKKARNETVYSAETPRVKPALMIVGPSGIGKTCLARALLHQAGFAIWTGRGCPEGPPSKVADESNGTLGEEFVAKIRMRQSAVLATRPMAVLIETLEGVSQSTRAAIRLELKAMADGPGVLNPDSNSKKRPRPQSARTENKEDEEEGYNEERHDERNDERNDGEDEEERDEEANDEKSKGKSKTKRGKQEKQGDGDDRLVKPRRARIPIVLTADDAWAFKSIAQYCHVVSLQRSDVEHPSTSGSGIVWAPVAPTDEQIYNTLDAIVRFEAGDAAIASQVQVDVLNRIVAGAHGSVRSAVNSLQFALRALLDSKAAIDSSDAVLDVPAAASWVCYGGSPSSTEAFAKTTFSILEGFSIGDGESVADLCQRVAPQTTRSLRALSRALDASSMSDVAFSVVRKKQAFELSPNVLALGAWGVGVALWTEPEFRVSASKHNSRFGVKPQEMFQMWGASAKRTASRRRWRLVGAATAPPAPGLSLAARALMCRPYALEEDNEVAQKKADAEYVASCEGSAAQKTELALRVRAARRAASSSSIATSGSSLVADEQLPPQYPAAACLQTSVINILERADVLRAKSTILLTECAFKPTQHAQRKKLLEHHGLYVTEEAARTLLSHGPFPSLSPRAAAREDADKSVVASLMCEYLALLSS